MASYVTSAFLQAYKVV